jgi:hypothetical protein
VKLRNELFMICSFLLSIPASARLRTAVWCFGDSAGIDFCVPNSPVPLSTP